MNKLLSILVLSFMVSCSSESENLDCGNTDEVAICGNVNKQAQPLIFKAKCAACHMLDKNSTGPMIQGILKRVPSERWFIEFLTNEDSLVKIGDEYTLEIEKWSNVDYKHNFKELTQKQIQEILDYSEQ